MAYEKQNFANGQILTATHLDNIENGIVAAEDEIALRVKTINGVAPDENGNVVVETEKPEDELPVVATEDNGKFLRVVNGAWVAAAVDSAEEASF